MPEKSVIRLTIGSKLTVLIGILLLTAVGSVTWISVKFFREDNSLLVQQLNSHEALALSIQTRNYLENIVARVRGLGSLDQVTPAPIDGTRRFFELNPDVLAVSKVELSDKSARPLLFFTPSEFSLKEAQSHSAELKSYLESPEFGAALAAAMSEPEAALQLFESSPASGGAPFVVTVPLDGEKGNSHFLAVALDRRPIEAIFKRREGATAYLVSHDGSILMHSEAAYPSGKLSPMPDLKRYLSEEISNRQIRYVSPDTHHATMAAVRKIGIGGLGVVAEVPEEIALEASQRVARLASLVAMLVFCVAVAVGTLYSSSLVNPILKLTEASKKVANGDFEIRVPLKKGKSGDEIRQLSLAFNQMANELQAREKYREIFVKYHSPEMAEKILSGDVKLGGEKREAVILFTDLRGFTSMSDSIAPEVIVEVLNDYMGRMISIIRRRGGVVDKLMGDGIMATWGVPVSSPEDPFNAISACLEMRQALDHFNRERKLKWRDPLRMGMGLNIGNVIAGNIGSKDRMEYTVIGDAVNIASRLEALTKDLDVDLVVSESIYSRADGRFEFVPGPHMSVRGRSEKVQVYTIGNLSPVRSGPLVA